MSELEKTGLRSVTVPRLILALNILPDYSLYHTKHALKDPLRRNDSMKTRCFTRAKNAIRLILFLAAAIPLLWREGSALGADGESKSRTQNAIAVWDTALHSAEPLTSAMLTTRRGWNQVPAPDTPSSFKGDAVISNGRITAVVRRQSAAVEVYAEGPESPTAVMRLIVITQSGEPASQIETVGLAENTKGAASLAISCKTEQGASVAAKFRIKRGEVFVETLPGAGAGRLRTDCPGRFVVLPDFFADDILIDASRIPLSRMEAPSDNFVLHLTGSGESIGMCVFENRKVDVKLALAGRETERKIVGSEIEFESKSIWVAALSAPHIWHHFDLSIDDAGSIIPLPWTMPFPAQWRVDFTRKDSLTDSWEMLLQEKKNGKYQKPSWLGGREETLDRNRWRWNTFLDEFSYPCWSDQERRGYVQPLIKDAFHFQGPAVVYPVNRVKQTPLDAYTVVDVMRSTLGVGPCEHILDVEGQKTVYRGQPTCGVQGLLEEIYQAKEQKKKRAEVEKYLNDGLAFVTHIRQRITRYIEFGEKMRKYLAAQRKAHPELIDRINELDKILGRIDKNIAPQTSKIQKPEFVAELNADFRKNILDYDGPDALERCQKYGKILTDIGGTQDELVGECRWIVRSLRQRAGIMVGIDPKLAPIANEIRARTQEALRNPSDYEWSRH
jgi:hypothetical protein